MPVYYQPRDFFRVAFNRPDRGSTTLYLASKRSLLVLPFAVGLTVLNYYELLNGLEEYEYDKLLTPFTLLLGLVTAFRLNDAFHKWERAGEIIYTLHRELRMIIHRLCACMPPGDPDVDDKLVEIRRLLLLGCVLMKSHVRHEGAKEALDEVCNSGLLTAEERVRLTAVVTIADGPTGDGKKDKYPSRARPTFAFQEASVINHRLFASGKFSCPHAFWGIEDSIYTMASTFEDAEHLGTSLLPLPYAQLTRLLTLIFLVFLPLAYVRLLGWVMVPLSVITNFVFFIVDECSGQMELPFGDDANDVEIEKIIRRADKLTAAQLFQFFDTEKDGRSSQPVRNHNLFPDVRSTDIYGSVVKRKVRMMGSVHESDHGRSPMRRSYAYASPWRRASATDRASAADRASERETSGRPSSTGENNSESGSAGSPAGSPSPQPSGPVVHLSEANDSPSMVRLTRVASRDPEPEAPTTTVGEAPAGAAI